MTLPPRPCSYRTLETAATWLALYSYPILISELPCSSGALGDVVIVQLVELRERRLHGRQLLPAGQSLSLAVDVRD